MMAGNETTRRRRGQGRTVASSDVSSTSRTSRPNANADLHQHHHHHDHHHHHYHYHHHYHHFPRPLNTDQERGSVITPGNVITHGESSNQTESNHTDDQGFVNNRTSMPIRTREAASEDVLRLEEMLRSLSVQSHRPGFRESLLEDFSLLFEDDVDPWGDEEFMELGIQEWLARVGFEEAVLEDGESLPEQGLSRSTIRRLPKEVFRSQSTHDRGASSDQEDCSVCLEHFVVGQQLICLPCKHRFHPNCLSPWLENHAKCPYCRAKVSIEGGVASSSRQTGSGRTMSSLSEDELIAWMEAVDSGLSSYISG
ncbi:hypothetical protein KP509_25G032100 [Ceratopteris richardii]|nr:hypothetical protein KP509_25G032100 [Ceratopteris richardii]